MASYPTTPKTFSTRSSGQTIQAAWFNDLQDEVTAIETGLINGIAHVLKPDGDNTRNFGAAGARWADARINRILLGANATAISEGAANRIDTVGIRLTGALDSSSGAALQIGTRDNFGLQFFTNNLVRWEILNTGHFRPNSDGALSLGDSIRRIVEGVFSTAVRIGTNPSSSNGLALQNAVWVSGRNAANTADLNIITLDSADRVQIGNGTSDILWNKPLVALGGGAAPTFGTIGGAGPTVGAQNSWMRVIDTAGATFWVPVWK